MTTETETPYTVDRLVGTLCQIWPYTRGTIGRDVLYTVWKAVEDAHEGHKLFWGVQDPPSIHADLISFCEFFDTFKHPDRILLLVQDKASRNFAGFLWFDQIVTGHRAFGSIFIAPAYRGALATEALNLCLDYMFHAIGVKTIWGMTPWPKALALIMRGGFENVATLQDFAVVNEQTYHVQLCRLTREVFDGLFIPERVGT